MKKVTLYKRTFVLGTPPTFCLDERLAQFAACGELIRQWFSESPQRVKAVLSKSPRLSGPCLRIVSVWSFKIPHYREDTYYYADIEFPKEIFPNKMWGFRKTEEGITTIEIYEDVVNFLRKNEYVWFEYADSEKD